MPTDLPPRRTETDAAGTGGDGPGDGASKRQVAGMQGAFAFVTLTALAVLILLPILREETGRKESFRVAVLEPTVARSGSISAQNLELLQVAVADAAERHLSGREGLVWVRGTGDAEPDSDPGTDPGSDPAARARAAGADEALVLAIACDDLCRASLRRVRAVDGSVTWQRPRFTLPIDDVTAIDQTIGDQVAVAYLKFGRRDGAPRLYASTADYRQFLEIRQRLERHLTQKGDGVRGADAAASVRLEAERLSELRTSSPRFLGSFLLEADAREWLAASPESVAAESVAAESVAGEPGADETDERQAVLDLLLEAHRIAPVDRRPLVRVIPMLHATGAQRQALDLLRELSTLYPRDPDVERLRRLLAPVAEPAPESAPEGETKSLHPVAPAGPPWSEHGLSPAARRDTSEARPGDTDGPLRHRVGVRISGNQLKHCVFDSTVESVALFPSANPARPPPKVRSLQCFCGFS